MRAVASVVKGRKVHPALVGHAMVVPGSGLVKEQAEEEGLDKIMIEAGMDWRQPGCSMCLAMNPDKLGDKERCASTSNRNFEGRQGAGGRTHLLSPVMAAAAAITGRLTDIREIELQHVPVPGEDAPESKLMSEQNAAAGESVGPVIREAEGGSSAVGMPVFDNLKGVTAPLDIQNIDTDMIIPKE